MSEPQDQLDSIHPSKKKQTRFKSSHHQAIKTSRSTLKRQTVSYERTSTISKDVTSSPLVKRAQTNITKSSILLPVKKYDLKIRMDTSQSRIQKFRESVGNSLEKRDLSIEKRKKQNRLMQVKAPWIRKSDRDRKPATQSMQRITIGAENHSVDLDEIDKITPSTFLEISSKNQHSLK